MDRRLIQDKDQVSVFVCTSLDIFAGIKNYNVTLLVVTYEDKGPVLTSSRAFLRLQMWF